MDQPTYFVSDLHLFARRSVGEAVTAEVLSRADRASRLVLGGDIFDFRWSTLGGSKETSEAACRWLCRLVARNPGCQISYILGNHDACPEFQLQLAELCSQLDNFEVHPVGCVVGRSFFTHGDGLSTRIGHPRRRALPAPLHLSYEIAVTVGAHHALSRLAHPSRRTLVRLHRFVEAHLGADARQIDHVYFGHTHRPVAGVSFKGRRYYNGGAAVRGCSFQILEVAS